MRIASILVLVLAVSGAQCAEPKLTKELGEKVRSGSGTLTEDEVIKLVPGPVKVALEGADRTLSWEELTFIELSYVNGKFVSAKAEFNDTVDAKRVTIDKFKQIKIGMTSSEVNQVLGTENSLSSRRDARTGEYHSTFRWAEGRKIFCTIKDGKVSAPCGWIEQH